MVGIPMNKFKIILTESIDIEGLKHLKTYSGTKGNNRHATATVDLLLDCKYAKYLKGKNNEHERHASFERGSGKGMGSYNHEEWEDFKDDVKDNGFKSKIFIVFEWEGSKVIARVYEGNHRIRIGCQLGIPIPAELKFFGKSEDYIDKDNFDFDGYRLLKHGIVDE